MKIKSLVLRNYKRFSDTHPPINFCDEWGEPLEIVLLVGDNGCGKSSVLQAIAAVVGGAVRPNFSPSDLEWPGFDYRYIQSGRRPVELAATLCFSEQEIEATRSLAERISQSHPTRSSKFEPPGQSPEVRFSLSYSDNRIFGPTPKEFWQAQGYQYALQLRRFEPNYSDLFEHVGSIYWYTEKRNSASIMVIPTENKQPIEARMNEDQVRNILAKFYRFHRDIQLKNKKLRPGQRDFFATLDQSYRTIFPNRRLVNSAPRTGPDEILDEIEDFFLSENGREYEVSGMSGGERAIFPLLIDFANWNINNSIILIDEVELHLHPPLQQALVRALPKLGRNNQFILTTHSDHVVSLFQEHQIIRLDQYEQATVS